MDHEPAPEQEEDLASPFKTKVGLRLFIIYALVYVAFVLINTFSPRAMGWVIWAGLNMAVLYGFGLIILAVVMGLIYNVICTRAENRLNGVKEK